MTLLDLIKKIEDVAAQQPQVEDIVAGDVYQLNERAAVLYGVFAWTQGQHVKNIYEGMTAYTFNLFYVDRLTADQKNKTEIQSVGLQVLGNILRSLSSYLGVSEARFQPFTERFADECAGVYCTVSITVPDDTNCEQLFQ